MNENTYNKNSLHSLSTLFKAMENRKYLSPQDSEKASVTWSDNSIMKLNTPQNL